MPGIVGFTRGRTDEIDAKSELSKMQELITHKNFYIKEGLFCDNHICATRSHTNIIQNNPQPYTKSGVYIWLDGEFYNQGELCNQYNILADNDPEILLKLYMEYDDFSYLKNIDGIYSAVIYDSRNKKIYLFTDRYGLRYLYWTVLNGRIAWGSEVKTMLGLSEFNPKIDTQALKAFINIGHMIGDQTWFEGVELLSAGTILIWDIDACSVEKHRYWWWDEIKPIIGNIDENAIVEELGRLFIDAVKRRSKDGEKVGISLSGGLDSRAILAAMPDRGYPIQAITFGKKNCDDFRFAQMAAKVKGAVHHYFELTEDNWLSQRLNGIWLSDGQKELSHIHGIGFVNRIKELYEISLNGFWGDAVIGGCYANNKYKFYKDNIYFNEIDLFNNRGRRFINLGPTISRAFLEVRLPFCDNRIVDLALTIPSRLRINQYIYKKMLLKAFPPYYKNIPWQETGFPITERSSLINVARIILKTGNKIRRAFYKYVLKSPPTKYYDDYPNWIRINPAKSFFNETLSNPEALYLEYLPRDEIREALGNHFNGKNNASLLCRYLTFEVWLQQVFNNNYRSEGKT